MATTPLASTTVTAYDVRGFKEGVQDAESRIVDYGYDKDGRMTSLANRRNETFSWAYM